MWVWLVGSVVSCAGASPGRAADEPKVVRPPASQGHELTSQEIRARVMGQLPTVRRCYELEFVKGQGASEASAIFTWKIASSGSVSDVTVVAVSPGAAATVKCAIGEIKKWRFPTSLTPTNVTWPFRWGTASSDGG
jgi:hypothetical protein